MASEIACTMPGGMGDERTSFGILHANLQSSQRPEIVEQTAKTQCDF